MDALCLRTGIQSIASSLSTGGSSHSVDVRQKSTVAQPPRKTASILSLRNPLSFLWSRGGGLASNDAVSAQNQQMKNTSSDSMMNKGDGEEIECDDDHHHHQVSSQTEDDDDDEECDVCGIDDEEEMRFDGGSFSKLLKRVSLGDAKLYAKMSYLGCLAYCIPTVKTTNVLKTRGLRYVNSSIEKDQVSAVIQDSDGISSTAHDEEQKNNGTRTSASIAHKRAAASVASYLQSQINSTLPLTSSESEEDWSESSSSVYKNHIAIMDSNMESLMSTDSMTAVVAANEEVKQAVASDLSSNVSLPCEWFICDDDHSATRFFVIQGSETLASWQANLLFEPIQFEEMGVLVHRGIYEAAKGMYKKMLPEVRYHLKSRGNHAKFQFTGHSLGGSLGLLVSLMLLIRGELPPSTLLPVITFGAPYVMCGGDNLLHKIGLPTSHLQAVVMHRDIVPRAFSCNYPAHVAGLLKAVNGNFRSHPCLKHKKVLYTPMGKLLVLQPDEKFSPSHDLLPLGSGLYVLSRPLPEACNGERLLQAAQMEFLNSPHPLEILSDRFAYGSGGGIWRNHDMNSYLKSVQDVIRQELNCTRKTRRKQRHNLWEPLVAMQSARVGTAVERLAKSVSMRQERFQFSAILQISSENVKRFGRLVASQHINLIVVLSIPARMLILDMYCTITLC